MRKIPINLELKDGLRAGVKLMGHILLEVFDNKENMKLISTRECHNLIPNASLDAILDIMLHGTTQITAWYCVISETDTSPAAGMTYAVPVFTEWAAYDEATRPAWVEAAASSQSITNSASKAEFTSNASKTLYGAGLVGGGSAATTKSDAAGGGTLFNYGEFASSQAIQDANVVNLTITITSADDGV